MNNLTKFPPRGKYEFKQDRLQEQQDHDAYAEALVSYRQASNELKKAIGVQKDFEKTSWSAAEAIEDLMLNQDKYALINRFEEAVINKLKAKERL
ncbi:hypothetical protein EA754_06295 [Acinetobacter pittii]|uniref:hypothetical protein n=1 Tax=Acinetobacter calcoaceticus/baumannii complex TaxID=909768 RepID=UPI0004F52202|nr:MULTISPECIES: hypothetical protein [Acinetobacter calcoaceticus/baumannii complex]RSO77203.1 hypothetical protein EA754_06295 [Acinetobacter pittii]